MRIRAQIRSKMDEKVLINVLSGLFDEKLQPVHNRLDRLEGRLDGMDSRLDRVESEIGALKEGQQKLRQELKRVSDKVYETYELALENWGQVQESKARLTALES